MIDIVYSADDRHVARNCTQEQKRNIKACEHSAILEAFVAW